MKGLPSSATPFLLPESTAWSVVSKTNQPISFSVEWQRLASHCGVDPDEFCALFSATAFGRWPCSVGGRLLEVTVASLDTEINLITALELTPNDVTALLSTTRGERKTLLCSSSGRLIALSANVSLETGSSVKTLQSLFEPGSRPAIQAGLSKCAAEGRVDEFLVSSIADHGMRENWILSLENVPAPGRLVFGSLSSPSLAMVNTGGTADSLFDTIIEENPSPTLVLDKTGVITKLNEAARKLALGLYGKAEIQGTFFWKWVSEEYREEAKANHDKRVRGYYAPSRYTLSLKPDSLDKSPLIEICVFPLAEGGDSVVFLSKRLDSPSVCVFPEADAALFEGSTTDTDRLIRILRTGTGADSVALLLPGQTITSGEADQLLDNMPLDPEARVWVELKGTWCLFQPVSGGGWHGTVALGGLQSNELRPCGELALRIVAGLSCLNAPQGDQGRTRTILEKISRVVGHAKKAREEGFDRTLRELASICNADRAVKAEVSSDGTMLMPVVTAGIQGTLPGISLGSDSIMAWVCVHGKSAFLADPIQDVRMSAAFPDSGSEIAVPIITDDIVTGVVLLATSTPEGFDGEAMALLETGAEIISALEATPRADARETGPFRGLDKLPEALVQEMENELTASSAVVLSASRQLSVLKNGDGADPKLLGFLDEAAGRIASSTPVIVGWLKAAAFGGKPDMQWSDPYEIALDLVTGWRTHSKNPLVPYNLMEPSPRFVACFDPSWLYVTINSLVRVATEHTGAGDSVDISFSTGSGFWSVQVENSGKGIPAADLPSLFKNSAESGGTSGHTGTGLDLPLAKKFTEAMGGTITVFSSRDRGTRFTLKFRTT